MELSHKPNRKGFLGEFLFYVFFIIYIYRTIHKLIFLSLNMKLFFMRHGVAESNATNDAARNLSQQGIREVTRVASHLKNIELSFDKIISSGYERANHTAHIISDFVGNGYEIDSRLKPSSLINDVHNVILENKDCENLLLVFHQPIMEEFLVYICSGGAYNGGLQISINTATLVCTQPYRLLPTPLAVLKWIINPDIV